MFFFNIFHVPYQTLVARVFGYLAAQIPWLDSPAVGPVEQRPPVTAHP